MSETNATYTTTPTTTPTTTTPIGAARAAALVPAAAPAGGCCDSVPARADLPPEPRLDLAAPDVASATAVAALLADRNRAAIMRMLVDGPLCVCEMAAALGEKPNNVSMHLARLREAGLVRAVRHQGDARWMFYERDEARCAAAAAAVSDVLR